MAASRPAKHLGARSLVSCQKGDLAPPDRRGSLPCLQVTAHRTARRAPGRSLAERESLLAYVYQELKLLIRIRRITRGTTDECPRTPSSEWRWAGP